jgi:hypothetical protein
VKIINELNNDCDISTILHTDLYECIAFIQSINKEKILLITSGSKASPLLSRIISLDQGVAIFIFCTLNDLYQSIESFIYQLVNKTLRTEDIDQLYIFRFIICDLSKSLKQEHQNMLSSNGDILTVCRGGKLNKEEFEKLHQNQGKLISTNGYLSTSRAEAKALAFATKSTKRPNVISVLFQIECDIKQIGNDVTFADIDHLSEYPNSAVSRVV